MAVENPSAPLLATVPGVELASTGYWNISTSDDWHPTADDMAAAVAALDCPAVRRPVLKFGHTGESGEGDPAIGLVDNLRITEDGQTLVGDFVGVPAWLAEADGEGRCVLASAYPDRSGEFQRNYVCQLGHTHPFVVHAMALLGVKRPGIGTLQSLYDLYANAPEKEDAVTKAAVALASTTVDQVRDAFYTGPGTNYLLWIREMFIDPPELIVQNDGDDTLQRVPYTVSGDGAVEFGDGQTVKVEYVNARAAAGKPVMAYASAAAARPKQPDAGTAPAAAAASPDKEKEGAVPDLKEGLAQLLGISADADDETIDKALTEAIAAKDSGADANATDEPEPVATPTLDTVAASAKQLGGRFVNDAEHAQLVADAAAGREALTRQKRDDEARVVDEAIRAGKILARSRDTYLGHMQRDPEGTTKYLAEVPAEFAVPLTESGHSSEPTAAVADDPTYKNWSF